MRAGTHVWLRSTSGQHLADRDGTPVVFVITDVQSLAQHGTWYQLHTSRPAAQEIFGGWHTGLSLTPVPKRDLREGTSQ
ncbi:hypothetical protein [Streptomyces sp. NPDC005898]|uniref:hypothetical protein n=1 Tax=Streptomyces sp. NPDC005898 TaxID=3157082 RepID=UPI0033E33CFB